MTGSLTAHASTRRVPPGGRESELLVDHDLDYQIDYFGPHFDDTGIAAPSSFAQNADVINNQHNAFLDPFVIDERPTRGTGLKQHVVTHGRRTVDHDGSIFTKLQDQSVGLKCEDVIPMAAWRCTTVSSSYLCNSSGCPRNPHRARPRAPPLLALTEMPFSMSASDVPNSYLRQAGPRRHR